MTRSAMQAVLLLLAVFVVVPSAVAAPSRASSRMRNLSGRMEVVVGAVDEAAILDSLSVRASRLGYAVADRDSDDVRLRLEKPAVLAEVAPLGARFEGTEQKRLLFEVVRAGKSTGRLKVIGALTLVSNPGATGQSDRDLGKQQPFRDELKSLMEGIRATFAR
jgi:hypothetical protein